MVHPSEKTEAEKLVGMLAIHAEMTREWKASKFHAVQKEWLEKTIFPLKLVVDSALSMGVGSIQGDTNGSYKYDENYGSRDEESGEDIHNLSQVVGFECWIDILRQKFDIPSSKVYFQDPGFTDLEKSFITSLGHTVLEHPQAFKILTRRTFLCSCRLYKDVVAACFSAAMPDLAVMSPLWMDSWVTSPYYEAGPDYNRLVFHESRMWSGLIEQHRMRRTLRRYARTHLSQKQGPIFERTREADLKDISIDRLMHSWLQDVEWYWTPNDLSVIGDIGEPINQEVWRFLPGIYGVIDSLGGGMEYVEMAIEMQRRRREESPLDEIPSGSEWEYEGKEDEPEPEPDPDPETEPEPEPEPKPDKPLPSQKITPRSPPYRDSYRGNKRRLTRIRKLRAYRDDGTVNFL
ncbi:hypothetical protein BCON_0328g00010 [Botryotinia convoluta]|uniref:SRR1-like domain-containing protein n=1 Tax=Botryotinia convoluta TaxID=54673 RepID=A0A4Z1HC40_9HELO|nr:hypothetical protein BCON_0328g00010 [Botryotinia convoluta]